MTRTENDLDIYYVVGNTNSFRQESEIGDTIKKINSLVLQLGSISNAVVDTTDHFSNLYLLWKKYE